MGTCDKAKSVMIEGEAWYYQTFYDDRGREEAVRLYDAQGEFVTVFDNVAELMDYLVKDSSESKIEALKAIQHFRRMQKTDRPNQRKETCVPEEERARNFSVFMKRLRMLKGDMTSSEFSEVLGLNQATVQNYLVGGRFPTGHAAKRIAERCGVSVDWLLGGV